MGPKSEENTGYQQHRIQQIVNSDSESARYRTPDSRYNALMLPKVNAYAKYPLVAY